MTKSSNARLKEAHAARVQVLNDLEADPYIGYPTLDAALAEYRCNTQAEVLARLLCRENLFISGPAGSGKSFILNRFTSMIDAQFFGKFNIALTASTGIAATIIGGQTIHSWAGLGIDTDDFDKNKATMIMKSKIPVMRATDVLIIDEISMLPAYLFNKLDAVLKWARRSTKPFGGVQLVLTGDFLQLPPVSKGEVGVDTSFSIQTQAWKEANIRYCYMDKAHRATDPDLKYLLLKIATGKAKGDPKVEKILKSRSGTRSSLCVPNKVYSTLFTVNKNVDEYNTAELAKNPNPTLKSKLERSGSKEDTDKVIKKYSLPEEVEYKIGATVMVTSNLRRENGDLIANGSIGKVTGRIGLDPIILFNDGKHEMIKKQEYPHMKKTTIIDPVSKQPHYVEYPVAMVKQLPLKLGYAITVHRSQGQTFDGVVTDLSRIFTSGLGYVALSRVRSLDDLVITGWNPRALELDPLSKKISDFVKRRSLESRKEFIEKRDSYEGILDNSLVRTVMWEPEESARLKSTDENWTP